MALLLLILCILHPEQTNKLISCTLCFVHSIHGLTYTKFLRGSSIDVLNSLDALVHSFIISQDYKLHLQRTGRVYECIDSIKAEITANPDNAAAVRKRWAQNSASMEDALTEVADLISGDGVNQGWDGLDIEPGEEEEMTTSEKDVCQKVGHTTSSSFSTRSS